MMNNLMFLSHGMQICMLILLLGLLLVFMKWSSLEARIKQLEDASSKYVNVEDYLETFNNMWDAKQESNISLAPYPE